MKQQLIQIALASTAAALMSACSVSAGGGSAPDVPAIPAPEAFTDKVTAPAMSLDGTWRSECFADSNINDTMKKAQSAKVTMTISGKNVTRQADLFTDTACKTAIAPKIETGIFRFAESYGTGAYGVEYRFAFKGGTYLMTEDFTIGSDKSLYISNEIGAQGAYSTIKLTRDGGAPATPAKPGTPPTTPPATTPIAAGSHVAKIGDHVVLKGTYAGSAISEDYSNQGYHSDSGQWSIFRDIQGAQNDMGYSYVATVWSSASTKDMLDNCVTKGGTLQVVTVPAGSFQTCALTTATRRTYYGDVPLFGKVKIEDLDGTYKTELQSFTWGDAH